jgi:uncharacterized iron-regulated membrane protein
MINRGKGRLENWSRERGQLRRSRWPREYVGLWGFLTILLFASSGVDRAYALALAQAENPTTTLTTSTSLIKAASQSPTLNNVKSTTTSGSTTVAFSSSKTTSTPGTVVTDSPLVKSKLESSVASLLQNFSSIGSVFGSLNSTASPTAPIQTILPSPSDGDGSDDGDDDGNNTSPDEKTYNSLLNFYFLILAGAIGFAVLGWYLWRRRRKGKTTRDQRRGLEALRRDLELGRLRRGILGVVGRGGSNNSATNEELPP